MNALSADLSKITDENDEVWRLLDGVLEERPDWAGMELLKSVKYGLYNLPWSLTHRHYVSLALVFRISQTTRSIVRRLQKIEKEMQMDIEKEIDIWCAVSKGKELRWKDEVKELQLQIPRIILDVPTSQAPEEECSNQS